ncbi:MAG: galactokinase family protein, partial [Bacteroidetes bacterium]|nr:galactokinase family protein [Bacteroidota bacterium]
MNKIEILKARINNPENKVFTDLYGSDKKVLNEQSLRYSSLLDRFVEFSGADDPVFFSSPGRTEIGGNHTDHN